MIIEEISKQKTINGVIHLSKVDQSFENLYLQVLKREKRLYGDEEVKLLPYASKINPHKDEWALRTKSFLRFKNYLSNKKSTLNILDIGCGNGWLSGQLANEYNHNYFCVDTNLVELEQGARL
ncbi:MAG: class I SAM-dependent methyltransferase, partial [Ignavibacteria bacterium]|nr:class I SAM-dependent methyltransferase [Ignavibacteria bacterium]